MSNKQEQETASEMMQNYVIKRSEFWVFSLERSQFTAAIL